MYDRLSAPSKENQVLTIAPLSSRPFLENSDKKITRRGLRARVEVEEVSRAGGGDCRVLADWRGGSFRIRSKGFEHVPEAADRLPPDLYDHV